MRAISPIGNYSIQLIEAVPKRGMDSTGTIVEYSDRKPVIAQFHRGGLTDWEQIAAFENFDFSGLPEGVNPITRVSMFDTEAYVQHIADAAERESMLALIDARLVHLQTIFPSEFLIVEKPSAGIPWPTYNDSVLEDTFEKENGVDVQVLGILSMQRLTGINPETIRLYEVENLNRPEVVEAMEALETERAAASEGAISVAF